MIINVLLLTLGGKGKLLKSHASIAQVWCAWFELCSISCHSVDVANLMVFYKMFLIVITNIK